MLLPHTPWGRFVRAGDYSDEPSQAKTPAPCRTARALRALKPTYATRAPALVSERAPPTVTSSSASLGMRAGMTYYRDPRRAVLRFGPSSISLATSIPAFTLCSFRSEPSSFRCCDVSANRKLVFTGKPGPGKQRTPGAKDTVKSYLDSNPYRLRFDLPLGAPVTPGQIPLRMALPLPRTRGQRDDAAL